MVSINAKLGLKPAGTRAFMKLPKDRAEAVKITSAKCPACQRTGARRSHVHPGSLVCSWCAETWEPTP